MDEVIDALDNLLEHFTEEEEEVPAPTPKPEPGRWALVRQWNTVWKDTSHSFSNVGVSAEAGVNSARIHVTVPDFSTTFHFDYAMSWSPLPASLALRETFEVKLRLDTLDVPEGPSLWGAEARIYDGWFETIGEEHSPPPAGMAGHLRGNGEWHGPSQGGLGAKAKEPPYSETVELELNINPADGDVQVVTVRAWAHGAGGGRAAAIHFHYEYRFQQ